MNGKVLDAALIAVFLIVFFGFAIFHPGLGNAIVAWVGLVGLGYYNSFVRHAPSRDAGEPSDQTRYRNTLRAPWQ
jgi:hypothetical protein